jgi:hypothetical protein
VPHHICLARPGNSTPRGRGPLRHVRHYECVVTVAVTIELRVLVAASSRVTPRAVGESAILLVCSSRSLRLFRVCALPDDLGGDVAEELSESRDSGADYEKVGFDNTRRVGSENC